MAFNALKAEEHYRNIDTINASIKLASRAVDQKAYCEVSGQKKLYTLSELTDLAAKEEQAIRALDA